jgi:hypothetical protein
MSLTTNKWIGTTSADWGANAANWSAGLPKSNDNVVIRTAAVLTVSYSGGDDYIVNSLTVGKDFFAMSGGSLTILTIASFADDFIQTGGSFTAGGAVTISGKGTLIGGSAEGATAFTISGAIVLANYTLGGATVLNNAKTVEETGQIALGDNTGTDATINNEKGAVFDIAGDFGIAQFAASARFINAGILEKSAGNSTSFIDVNFDDTGKIMVATGTLEFRGPNDSFAGAITGIAGQFAIGGGNDLIKAGTAITTGTFGIYNNGTLVTLGENLGYAGAFNVENSATLDLAGVVLTLSGPDTFINSLVQGSGTLVTARGGSANVNSLTLGGTINWQNFGTVGEVNPLQLGDATFNAATFTNEKGAVYKFTTDAGINRGAALNSSFVNDTGAILEKTGGGGDSIVLVDYSGGGAIKVITGTIEYAGVANGFSGPISGAGQFAIGGGSSAIASGATIKTAIFGIYNSGTSVTLGKNLSYARTFNLENSAALDLAGVSLSLSGTDTFSNSSVVQGTGALVTASGGIASVSNFTLAGAVDWQNSGRVNELGPLTIGDASFDIATFTNEKGGVYDFLTNDGIVIGAVSTDSFVNLAGAVLEKTAGTGNSQIFALFTNDGRVKLDTGAITFEQPVSGTGSFTIEPGTMLAFAASVGAGSSVDFATTTGGELFLGDSRQFAAAIHGFGGSSTNAIDLLDINITSAGFKLSYSGNSTQGVLTVTDGTNTAKLTMFGNYTTASFTASNNGGNGTLIVDSGVHALLASAR